MKKWVIIDDCTSSKSAQFEQIIEAKDKAEAEAIARREWSRMSAFDQKKCDAYFVGYAELDENNCADLDTMTDIVDIK